MDTLTHALAGTLIAQAGFRQRMGRVATVALTVSAALPDIDALPRLGDTAFYLTYHRGITHSLFGGAILALLLAGIFYRLKGEKRYWLLAGICYLGILSHILLDLFTTYGTRVFLPFSDLKVAWDTLYILDPFVSGIILGGIVMAYWLKGRSVLVGRTALALLAGYLLFAGVNHHLALLRLQAQVEQEGLQATDMAALPMPYGPFRWSGVVATKEATYQNSFSLFDGEDRPFHIYPHAVTDPYIRRADEEDVVALFKRFARFPVVTTRRDGVGPVVEYVDLRFTVGSGRVPFVAQVAFDQNGQPRSAGFTRR